ncbi:hypothetical protein [Rhizobium rhizosphaerae]|uniref:hypothetical protein n=1 Tax=Xaviernesmea rhizosphaerae TaxID=1672749 RepID=UPI000AB5AEC4|nr:hypothetical protein [Xaviernesmea rhizosphaerae]
MFEAVALLLGVQVGSIAFALLGRRKDGRQARHAISNTVSPAAPAVHPRVKPEDDGRLECAKVPQAQSIVLHRVKNGHNSTLSAPTLRAIPGVTPHARRHPRA